MKTQIDIRVLNKQTALAAQGLAGSRVGHRKASQPHRDRKAALKRGEAKHKASWV